MKVDWEQVHQLFYQLFVVCFLASEAHPFEVPTGPKVFLDFAGRVWAAALRPDPLLKKSLVPYLSGEYLLAVFVSNLQYS